MQTLKVSQIAEILGTTVKTVNNHRNKGRLSTQIDGDGHQSATPVEVQRAYESKYPDIGRRLQEYTEGTANKNKQTSQISEQRTPTKVDELLKNQEDRHEKEIDRLEAVYAKADERMSKVLHLLEHHTKEAEELKNTVKKLIERDQKREDEIEQQRKHELETEQKIKEAQEAASKKKTEEEAQAELKRKEEEYEAAQTWVSKMFGKKKTA